MQPPDRAGKKTRPEGIAEADWDKQKTGSLGRAYWVVGMVFAQKSQWVAADKSLREALPYIKGNNAMLAPALFYLGTANYNLGKMTMNKAKILEGANSAISAPPCRAIWRNRLRRTRPS